MRLGQRRPTAPTACACPDGSSPTNRRPTAGAGAAFGPRQARPRRLVRLPAARVRLGTNAPVLPGDGEGPARAVRVTAFAIDPHAVTNAWFGEFVRATGYRTEAEGFGFSLVFAASLPGPAGPPSASAPSWWRRVEGASWQAPEGPQANLAGRRDHPVVHVSWNDAVAFAAWAGGRLPTEAEWEYAAAGGRPGARFPWGDAEPDDVAFQPCNIWQGQFPSYNSGRDGYLGTAPVDAFAANGYGLFNMSGNTWEWCADRFRVRSLSRAAQARNRQAREGEERLLKGGSYLCHRSYCYRYRIAARTGAGADSSTAHVGFRLVFDDEPTQIATC